MIGRDDRRAKNDGEYRAAVCFATDFRHEHLHMKAIFRYDGLASKGPYIKHLQEHDIRFIIVAKPGDHAYLFDGMNTSDEVAVHATREKTPKSVIIHRYRWLNELPLNDTHHDVQSTSWNTREFS